MELMEPKNILDRTQRILTVAKQLLQVKLHHPFPNYLLNQKEINVIKKIKIYLYVNLMKLSLE